MTAAVLAVVWALFVGLAFDRYRPAPGRVVALVDRGAKATRRGRPDVVGTVGALVLRVGRRPTTDRSLARRVGFAAVAAAVVALPLVALTPKLVAVAAPGVVAAPMSAAHRHRRRRREEVTAALPEVVDLLAVGVGAGLTVGQAVDVVSRHLTNPVTDELAAVGREVAVGRPLADALDDVPRRLGDEVRPLTAALAASERYGTAIRPVLDRLAEELRAGQRRDAEALARRVPVKLLFPLVVCILPAFALLTVAPLIASAARSLRL